MLLYIIYALLLGSAYSNVSDNAASAGGKHMLMLSLNPVVVPPWFFQRRQLVQGTWLNCLLGVICFLPCSCWKLSAKPSDFLTREKETDYSTKTFSSFTSSKVILLPSGGTGNFKVFIEHLCRPVSQPKILTLNQCFLEGKLLSVAHLSSLLDSICILMSTLMMCQRLC